MSGWARDLLECSVCGKPAPRGAYGHRRYTCSEECLSVTRQLTVRDRFLDAGREPWTRERIIEVMRRWARERGRSPSWNDWEKGSEEGGLPRRDHPNPATVQRRFGSWSAALHAAGLESNPRGPRGRKRGRPKGTRYAHPDGKCGKKLHAWVPENIYIHPKTGYRQCRPCRTEAVRRLRESEAG